jgi:plasmid replication initiation protein
MAKKQQSEVIKELQNNSDFVILNNPLATPKFVRKLGKGKEVALTEVYTPKLFYDIISRLTTEHLEQIENGKDVIKLTISIGNFLNSISTGKSKSLYRHVIDCIDLLQTTQVKWKEGEGEWEKESGTAIITHYDYHPRQGKVDIVLYKDFVKQVLQVTKNEHFSFLKKHLHFLQNAQAIKLFPFFLSWKNKGMVEMSIEAFKQKCGYDTEGYKKFNNLRLKVLEPALAEINAKTDLVISYKLLGDNLQGIRQRVTSIQFFISEKEKVKELPVQLRAEKPTAPTILNKVETPVTPPEPPAPQETNEYLEEILRVFSIFEPTSAAENIEIFISAFDSFKEVLEGCLHCEKQKNNGYKIGNFRAFLKIVIREKQGTGILEQREKEQFKKTTILDNERVERIRSISLAQQYDTLLSEYRSAINLVIKKTATEFEKENVLEILRVSNPLYSNLTLEKCREKQYISAFISKFIETYFERFESSQNTFQNRYNALIANVPDADKKFKGLFY